MNETQQSRKPRKRSTLIVSGLGLLIILFLAIAVPNFITMRTTSASNSCINNLRVIFGAKQQWMLENKKQPIDTPTWNDLAPYMKTAPLICPKGGTYTLHNGNEDPTCSIPEDKLP